MTSYLSIATSSLATSFARLEELMLTHGKIMKNTYTTFFANMKTP
jgi:hypothetical protein